MFWIIIVLFAVVAFSMPWTFKYLIMMPLLGFVLGGFVWAVVGLFGGPVYSMVAFGLFVLAAMFFIGLMIHKYDP